MFKTSSFAAVVLVASVLSGCGNKHREKCLADVAAYEKGKIDCLAKTDKKAQEACTDANEVKKISAADCE